MAFRTLIASLAVACVVGASQSLAGFPEKPIKLVVPYGAGGSSDTFARTIQKGITDLNLLPVPVVVENMAGGGSSLGMRYVKDSEPDGYTVLVHHLTTHTAPAFDVVDFDWRAYAPVAQMAIDPMVYVVMKDSKHDSLRSYLDAAAAAPDQIREATAFGTTIHVMSLVMDDAYESKFGKLPKRTLVQSGGTSKRLPLLMGGHVEGMFFTFAELNSYKEQGLRGLAIFTDKRNALMPDLPTAIEQGIDVVMSQTFWIYAAKDTPQDRIDYLADVFKKALDTPAVTKSFAAKAMQKSYLAGQPLHDALTKVSDSIAASVAKHKK